MSSRKSIACKVLRKRLDELATAFQDQPIRIVSWLLSEKVLLEPRLTVESHGGASNAQLVREVLKVMLNAVETDENMYDKFVAYLKSEKSLGHLVNLLQETYGKSTRCS